MKYSLTIKTSIDTYKGKGDTAVEALRSIPKPFKVMCKGTVTLEYDKKRIEVVMYPTRIKRLFNNKMFQEIFMTKLCKMMK